MKSILRYLKMPSTWKGLTWMLTLLGVALSPEQREAIGVAGVAIVAAIEMFTDEDKRPRDIKIELPPIEMQSKSQFDERGFNKYDRHNEDDGFVTLDTLRHGMRVNMPPDHIAGTEYDERQSGFNDQ